MTENPQVAISHVKYNTMAEVQRSGSSYHDQHAAAGGERLC
jgi:hypothetical protein